MKDRILDRIIRFDKLLGVTAIAIALVAAFFSVYGIATLFAGAFTLTAIMATSLEVGKLVAVTFLYRYWQKTQTFLKTYLSIATVVLMLITSMGIFGYLSAAYQKSAIEYKASQDRIVMVEGQKTYLSDKISQAKIRIQTLNDMRKLQEGRMNESITNAFLARNPIQMKQLNDQTVELIKNADDNIKSEQNKIQSATDDIAKIDQQVNEMRFASANKKDIRTFQFVADQFNMSLDSVAKWFIFTLIFVFDPLAVALILAYNIVAYKKPVEEALVPQPTNSENPKKSEIVDSPAPVPPPTPPQKDVIITPSVEPSKPADPGIDGYLKRMFKL